MDIRTAILVDGSFFLKRLFYYKRTYFPNIETLTSEEILACLDKVVTKHLKSNGNIYRYLYRVFYYDAMPLEQKLHYPIADNNGRRPVKDYKTDKQSIIRRELFSHLKKQRKYAVRLGNVKHDKSKGWKLTSYATDDLINKKRRFEDITNGDFYFEIRQKGVDIKLGLDIATLSYEKLVDQIVLIAGDSDFVPAAKLARIHGIDFVLDNLRNNIDQSLHEHIDGLNTFDLASIIKDICKCEPHKKPEWWKNTT
ncbi:NYN domain-containing protein [Spartinivicinus ruber]|uniref:NYN domain-containing protein n=1 Tax=Spartinivicinus ruber TaxID=2683272 RepID=UPI0013D03367|nr:NYN domain-containing protein [Spartinivicinus ruber]